MDDNLLAELTSPYAPRWLTALDRCDRCHAQAQVVTDHDGTELMWCVHHYGKYKARLSGLIVHDERQRPG